MMSVSADWNDVIWAITLDPARDTVLVNTL